MHPEIVQDHPGSCPICGMDLVSRDPATTALHDHGVHVDAATLQKVGVRLASAKRSVISGRVRTYGKVTADATARYSIHSFFDGVIKKTNIHSVGQKIRQGQVIYEIYSPELNMQQNEYLKFNSRRNQILNSITGDTVIYENEYVMDLLEELSRERTKFLREDIGIDTVQKLDDHKRVIDVVPILAAVTGVVTEINVRAGDFVTPSMTLFTVDDLDRIWVTSSLYPDQAVQVHENDEVILNLEGRQAIRTRISFVSPVAENNRVEIRMELDNSKLRLRPGSYADVTILADPHEAMTLPASAILRSGAGNSVILSLGDGHFLPVPVETGIESDGVVEITYGIQPGAEVAVNGQFLLDAAASMNAAIERMRSGGHTELHDAK